MLADRLRRLRKIGIEISFGREGRARTRIIHIITTGSRHAPETEGPRPSASSAPSAFAPKPNPANGFAAASSRTVANDADGRADGSGGGRRSDRPRQTVENQCRDRCGRCGRKSPPSIRARINRSAGLESAVMSAAEALKAARAAGISLRIEGDDLLLEAPTAAPPPAVLDILSRHKADIVNVAARARGPRAGGPGACSASRQCRWRRPSGRIFRSRMASHHR
jgi:hypothetical protein